jgi:hypothetical protein
VKTPLRGLTANELDTRPAEYMETFYLSGEAAGAARYALCGVCFALDLVTRDALMLPLAKKTLKGFARKAPEPSRDPPPMETAWLAADYFAKVAPAPVGAQAALLTLFAADGYPNGLPRPWSSGARLLQEQRSRLCSVFSGHSPLV